MCAIKFPHKESDFDKALKAMVESCALICEIDERNIYWTSNKANIQTQLDVLIEYQKKHLYINKKGQEAIPISLQLPHIFTDLYAIVIYQNTACCGITHSRDSLISSIKLNETLKKEEQLTLLDMVEATPYQNFRSRAESFDYRLLTYIDKGNHPDRFTFRKAGVICCGTEPRISIKPSSPKERADKYAKIHAAQYVFKYGIADWYGITETKGVKK